MVDFTSFNPHVPLIFNGCVVIFKCAIRKCRLAAVPDGGVADNTIDHGQCAGILDVVNLIEAAVDECEVS